MCNLMESTSTMTFTFQGGYEVDALAVAKTIESLVSIATELAKMNYPEARIGLSVRAVREGSLNFDFVALSQAAQTLLTSDNVQCARSLIELAQTCFGIKKFLGGKKPKSVQEKSEKIVVKNCDGGTLEIPTGAGVYFINSNIDASVSKIFDSVVNSSGVTGVKLAADGMEDIQIPKEEFERCAIPIATSESCEPEKTFERKNEVLFIRRPDFAAKSQWGFTNDKNFSAEVKDDDFLNKVKNGEISIRAKTYIVADVSVTIHIDENGAPDESKCRYVVTKVHEIHYPDEQPQTTL